MFDVVCIGNALVDIIVNVSDSFLLGAKLKKGCMTLTDDISQKFLLSSITDIPNFVDQLSPKQKLQHLHFTIIYSTPNNALSFLETYLLNRGFNLRVVRNKEEARVLVAD